MKFRIILLILTVITTIAIKTKAQTGETGNFAYFTNEQISLMKKAVDDNDPRVGEIVKYLKRKADSYLKQGPWSVTFEKANSPSGDPHDFYSEGTYWWPDPKNPDGPYIRKDGVRNPNRFTSHDDWLSEVYNSVFYLSMGAYFLNDKKYADHASLIIYTWFINPETKMNPHMDYAQAIKGVTTGRGTGIIDAHRYAMFVDAVQLLHESNKWNDKYYDSLIDWFRQFNTWLTKSKNGLREMNSGNNHATWWTALTMANSILINDSEEFNELVNHTKNDLISKEIEADGSCPREEARTRSLHYSVFNIEAFALICRMAELRGIDLWKFTGTKGGSIIESVEYLMPYMKDPGKWEKEQIDKFENKQPVYLSLAYLATNKPEYKEQYQKMGDSGKARNNEPFKVLINMLLSLQN